MHMDDLSVFSGNANRSLAVAICQHLRIPLGDADVFQFSNENIFVKINDNVRGHDVFVVQPFNSPVNRSIMELLIMIDAFKRASAARITAVIPNYAYGRTDKKDQPRVPITAQIIQARYFAQKKLGDLVIVSADEGFAKKARKLADRLNAPLAIV